MECYQKLQTADVHSTTEEENERKVFKIKLVDEVFMLGFFLFIGIVFFFVIFTIVFLYFEKILDMLCFVMLTYITCRAKYIVYFCVVVIRR